MKKILFISDMHIGDGSAKDDFEYDDLFEKIINDFSELSDIELCIVGDGLEILETRMVLDNGLIPFKDLVNNIEKEVLIDIEKKHPKVFKALRRFGKSHKINYIVGNHDYYFLKNEKLCEKLCEMIPNLEIKPYFYDASSKILVVHGNQFDPINRFTIDRKTGELIPPLGDFIVRYMMNHFDNKVRNFVPKEIIKDYDNVRPTLDLFYWFEVVMETYNLGIDLLEMWVSSFYRDDENS
ncbi:metallophosphoesterase [Thermosipho ferrireducens]|uniref:metallophosphoesterase n=1 Tax=Thermosipho ferrireducens TaxID=2571116 RepID=UPI002B1BE59B|nr:metallophosphoesterase [Thermosipho ferrireducens]